MRMPSWPLSPSDALSTDVRRVWWVASEAGTPVHMFECRSVREVVASLTSTAAAGVDDGDLVDRMRAAAVVVA